MKTLVFSFVLLLCQTYVQSQVLGYANLNAVEFHKQIQQTGILLDVRTPREYDNGHIPGSNLLNFYTPDFGNRLLTLPKDKNLYIYCNTGYRSRVTANFLVQRGYDKVYNLQRGILEWNQQSLPLEKTEGAQPITENSMEPDEFKALINSDTPVFIDFYAPWCAPCRRMMPMIDSLQKAYKDKVTLVKINVDASKTLASELGVRGIPFFQMYVNGKKIFEHTGVITEEELVRVLNR